jgi:hypothetical protein
MDGLDALGRLVGELQRLQVAAKRAEHERAFWEDRYRVQHGTVHRLEARLQAAEHALRELWAFVGSDRHFTAPLLEFQVLTALGLDVPEGLAKSPFVVAALAAAAAPSDRVDELAALETGWLDGEGEALTEPALAAARGLQHPRLFPTPDGGAQAEWTIGAFAVSVTVAPDGSVSVDATDVRGAAAPSGETATE